MQQFEEAKGRLSALKKDPGNEVKLRIYALFKQVSCSPCWPKLRVQSEALSCGCSCLAMESKEGQT